MLTTMRMRSPVGALWLCAEDEQLVGLYLPDHPAPSGPGGLTDICGIDISSATNGSSVRIVAGKTAAPPSHAQARRNSRKEGSRPRQKPCPTETVSCQSSRWKCR